MLSLRKSYFPPHAEKYFSKSEGALKMFAACSLTSLCLKCKIWQLFEQFKTNKSLKSFKKLNYILRMGQNSDQNNFQF
jgi:hypothetical protein